MTRYFEEYINIVSFELKGINEDLFVKFVQQLKN